MLVITRKCGESIIIEPGQGCEPIEIKIISNDGGVKVGVSAPKECKIWRDELFRTVEANRRAADMPAGNLKNIAAELLGRND